VIDGQLEKIFGSLSTDITDAIYESVYNGAKAWDLFEEAGAKVIGALGKQLVQELYVQSYLDTFKDRMREAYSLGSIEDTQRELASIMTDIYGGLNQALEGATTAVKEWDAMAAKSGFDLSKLYGTEETVREGSKGLAASMTQDQASEMNGFLNHGLVFWRDIANNTGLILANLTSGTDAGTELMKARAQNMLTHLANIDSHTSRLEAIERDISDIGVGIKRMTDWGVRMR
jgi:hypothetical protein